MKTARKNKSKKFQQDRSRWFRGFKQFVKIGWKKPKFVFLGEKPQGGAIILSNHEGSHAPMSLELYAQFPLRFWGTHEMTSGFRKLYKYQTEVYYHNKHHWPLWLAKLLCVVISPLTNLFYKGLNLIPTYSDARFWSTLKHSVSVLQNGENIVIFPEHSQEGYFKQLTAFSAGFTALAHLCAKRGMDVPIYVSYLDVKRNIYVFDKPILFSSLQQQYPTRDQLAEALLQRCNQLPTLVTTKSKTDKCPVGQVNQKQLKQ